MEKHDVIAIVAMFTIVATPTMIVAKNTIVATPTTIVANVDQPKLLQHQSQMLQLPIISILYKILTFDPIFNDPCFTSHNQTMEIVKYCDIP